MIESKSRQSNIELLRIIAMSMVIFLHYFNAEIGGGIEYVQKGTINEAILQIFEAISICAVNLFVMISGFFLSDSSKRTLGKALVLLIQVIVYRLLYYIILCAFSSHTLTMKGVMLRLLPVNWFVVLYVVIYMISPLVNCAFDELDRVKKLHTTLLLLGLFSIWPTVADLLQQISGNDLMGLSPLGMYGSQRGYTITQFVICYIIGMITNKLDLKNKLEVRGKSIRRRTLFMILFADIVLLTAWGYINAYTGREYCNPLVIAEAWVLLVLFLKTEIKYSKLINNLAKSAFSVYLIHSYILPHLMIEYFVNASVVMMILHIFFSMLIIIALSFVIDKIYNILMHPLLSRIRRIGDYSL